MLRKILKFNDSKILKFGSEKTWAAMIVIGHLVFTN